MKYLFKVIVFASLSILIMDSGKLYAETSCDELSAYLKNTRTLLESYYADNQKYPVNIKTVHDMFGNNGVDNILNIRINYYQNREVYYISVANDDCDIKYYADSNTGDINSVKIETITSAPINNDELVSYTIGSITSDSIFNVSSKATINDIGKYYDYHYDYTNTDTVYIYNKNWKYTGNVAIFGKLKYNTIINPDALKYQSALTPDFKTYETEPVITEAVFDVIFEPNIMIEAGKEIMDRFVRKLKLSGLDIKKTELYCEMGNGCNQYAVDKFYRFEDKTNLSEGYIAAEICDKNVCNPNGIRIKYEFGLPNAVKIETEIVTKSNYDVKATAVIETIRQDNFSRLKSIQLDIYRGGKKAYIDAWRNDHMSNGVIYLHVVKMNKDAEPVILLMTCEGGNAGGTYVDIFTYDIANNKYKANETFLHNPEMIDVDRNGTMLLVDSYSFLEDDAPSSNRLDIPVVRQIINGVITNTTNKHISYINNVASNYIAKYKETKNQRTYLIGYMICKYIIGNKSEAWKQYDTLYKGKDKLVRKANLSKEIDKFMIDYWNYK